MRYLGFFHDPHFHHFYRARNRRVFTTDDVIFVETDIQLPNYSGYMEIELTGLQGLTPEERQLVDAHADRDDEVDWEQRALSHIDETIQVRESTSSLPSSQASVAEGGVLKDTLNDSSTPTLLPKPSPLSDDDGLTDSESVFQLHFKQLCEAARDVRSRVTNEPVRGDEAARGVRSRVTNEPVRGDELCEAARGVRPCDEKGPVRGNVLRETAQDVMEPANGAFVGHGALDTFDLVSLMLLLHFSCFECVYSNGYFRGFYIDAPHCLSSACILCCRHALTTGRSVDSGNGRREGSFFQQWIL